MAEWQTMKNMKPVDPEHFNGLDYGYIVRVKEGEHAGKEGLAVMFSRFGDVGVKTEFPEEPCFLNGYVFREQPENLEIIARAPLIRSEWEAFKKLPSSYDGFDVPEEGRSPIFTFDQGIRQMCEIFGHTVPFASMENMTIDFADKEKHVYAGDVFCVDHLEGCQFSKDWIAHPFQSIHKVNGKNYAFEVRPAKKDDFFGKHFTLSSAFNDMIAHYVMHGLVAFNPDLPFL